MRNEFSRIHFVPSGILWAHGPTGLRRVNRQGLAAVFVLAGGAMALSSARALTPIRSWPAAIANEVHQKVRAPLRGGTGARLHCWSGTRLLGVIGRDGRRKRGLPAQSLSSCRDQVSWLAPFIQGNAGFFSGTGEF